MEEGGSIPLALFSLVDGVGNGGSFAVDEAVNAGPRRSL